MAKTYLDETGLATLWNKIKTYVSNAVKVTGVKGNSESSYRTGNVNLTAANVGAAAASHTQSADTITSGYLNIHPENSSVLIPFIHNDLAFLTKKGGSYRFYKTNATVFTTETLAETGEISTSLDYAFDGSPSYANFHGTVAVDDVCVIDLTLPNTFTYSNLFYIDFGSSSWRAKNITLLVKNANNETDYVQKGSVTNQTLGHWYMSFSHTSTNTSGTTVQGFNRIRIVISGFGTGGKRIAQIGLVNYGSSGVAQTYMSRGANDRVYRTISPFATNTYDLGESSYKWNNVYATTLSASKMGNNTKLLFPQTSGSDTGIEVTNATNSLEILFGIGSGQVNRGIYDRKLSKWIIHADNSNVYLNGTVVPSSPKFTDTVTTATTTGSGNAVTAITASNGALTVTKGSTFLTQHQSNANLGHGYYTVTTSSSGVYAINASGYNLVEGSRISILFSNAVTEATPKLNVNNTGAKSIYYNGSALNPTAVTYATAVITSGSVVTFVYQGTYFAITAIENPKRIVVPGYQLDSTGGNSTKIMKMSNYTLCAGSLFTASFLHDNTASSILSLNINETGAKTLFINGKQSSSSNCTLPAGTYLIYYDGTNYYVRTDGKYPGASSLPTREDITSDFITSNLRVSIGRAIRYGKEVELELLVERSAAWANGASGDITATLTSNHLPYKPVSTTVMWSGGVLIGTIAGEGGYINNTSSSYGQGYVLLRNVSGASISKDSGNYISFTFRYIYDDGNITIPDLSGWQSS